MYLLSLKLVILKCGFFSESSIHFLDLQISKKDYSKKTILSLKFKFPANYIQYTVIGRKFKFQTQDSVLEYFFWRFADLENESNFLKRSHLYTELKGFQEWLYEFISLKILAWKAIKCSSCLKKCFRSHFFIVFFFNILKKIGAI